MSGIIDGAKKPSDPWDRMDPANQERLRHERDNYEAWVQEQARIRQSRIANGCDPNTGKPIGEVKE